MLGNVIQQGPVRNSTIISYGAEGYRWPENRLEMAFNTIINDRSSGGTFLRVAKGASHVLLLNNVWIGKGMYVDARWTRAATSRRPERVLESRSSRLSAEQDFPSGRTGWFPRSGRVEHHAATAGVHAPGFQLSACKPHATYATDTRRVPDDRSLVHDALRGPRRGTIRNRRRVATFWLVSTRMIRCAKRR